MLLEDKALFHAEKDAILQSGLTASSYVTVDDSGARHQGHNGYVTLNLALKRIAKNKSELLRVLERPEIPLHTNGSETDIRDYVKKKKVSGGTRSDEGHRCRDTFATLKKTCRKQGISFWDYLSDRLGIASPSVVPLPGFIIEQVTLATGY